MRPAMTSNRAQEHTKRSVSFRLPARGQVINERPDLEGEGAAKGVSVTVFSTTQKLNANDKEDSTESMDTIALFQGACNKNGIRLSSANPALCLTPPVTPSRRLPRGIIPLTYSSRSSSLSGKRDTLPAELTPPTFESLPKHVRKKIWKLAAKALPARTIRIQPSTARNLALSAVNSEARAVFLEEYSMLHSRQVGRMVSTPRAFSHCHLCRLSFVLLKNPSIRCERSVNCCAV